MKKITLSNFRFKTLESGGYIVKFTSFDSGRSWSNEVHDQRLIESTKNAFKPTQKNLHALKSLCKD